MGGHPHVGVTPCYVRLGLIYRDSPTGFKEANLLWRAHRGELGDPWEWRMAPRRPPARKGRPQPLSHGMNLPDNVTVGTQVQGGWASIKNESHSRGNDSHQGPSLARVCLTDKAVPTRRQ